MKDSGPLLKIEDFSDLLLVLLYAPGKSGRLLEPIEGTTRLQKLMFLLRQGEGPKKLVAAARELGYEPYKMGPFSEELRDVVEDLVAASIIDRQRLEYSIPEDSDAPWSMRDAASIKRVESYRYSLAEGLGVEIGTDLWGGLPTAAQHELTEFKAFFNSLTLRQLLIFTYEKFPEYTDRSTIKHQLGL